MYAEDEYIQLSALQHYLFCPRQCALAYMEMIWSDNILTAEGKLMHEQVHGGKFEKRGSVIKTRGLWIASAHLGLSGQTDLVEFHKTENSDNSVRLPGYSGYWQVFPVEFKRGKPKTDHSDEVQLCAQAICLEEMLNTKINEGAIFYGNNKRRHSVAFNQSLRILTEERTKNIHNMFKTEITPAAEYSKKCKSCSLYEKCLPEKYGGNNKVKRYIEKIFEDTE